MKILITGKLPSEKVYEGKCRYCGTIFEFAEKEGKIHDDQRDGRTITIDCPLCSKSVLVDA